MKVKELRNLICDMDDNNDVMIIYPMESSNMEIVADVESVHIGRTHISLGIEKLTIKPTESDNIKS